MKDFDGPDYPVYYENIGTDSLPRYVRDENMFVWLNNQFPYGEFLDFRLLDIDNDADYDIILFLFKNHGMYLRAVLYENTGHPNLPRWNTVGDTLFQEFNLVREINISNVLNDSLPQITVISDSGAKFYRQQDDSLIQIPGYFNPIQYMGWGYNNGPTKIEFFKIPQDTSQYIIVNREYYDMWVSYYYQRFEIYKNTGSKLQPNWQLQESKTGHWIAEICRHDDTV
jgi:hypothetical protein